MTKNVPLQGLYIKDDQQQNVMAEIGPPIIMPLSQDMRVKTASKLTPLESGIDNSHSTKFALFISVISMLSNGFFALSNSVADFLGITSPRYEMWMSESLEYQRQV